MNLIRTLKVGGSIPPGGTILIWERDKMKRSTAYFREMAWRHAIRKRRIAREVYPYNDFGWDYY